MDADHFDSLLRSLAGMPSRRAVTQALGGLGLTGALGPLLGLADVDARKKKKKCKKCGPCQKCKKGKCKPKPDGTDCGGGQLCQSGACTCPEGQDACGGACLASCPQSRIRNPVSCDCCRPSGVVEQVCDPIHEVCCSGLECKPVSGEGGTSCLGRTLGQPCDFDAQCASNNCNSNLVCA